MKKLLYSAAALSLAFFSASCQQENLEPVGTGSNTVTYSVQVPDAIATKANPGSVAGVTELIYEVYRLDADDNMSLAYEDVVTLENGETKWDLELEFVKDQKFQVLFWAQKPNVGAYNTVDLREVSLNSATLTANVDDYAAFAGYDYVTNCVSHQEGKVTLVRPISQIQVGTDAAGLVLGTEGSNKVNISLTSSSMLVKGLPTTYNVANGEASDDAQEVEYTVNAVPAGTFTANSKEYTYVAQNYVAFAASLGTTVEVDFTVKTSEGDVQHTVSNVPLKPNYRTNIIGNLITENADYSIDLEANWADDDKSMEVIVDGLVKNINGDYEVTEAKGLAYAINNLFELGGDFYLTAPLYDLSGFAVTAPSVPAGVTLNIYGETPVVTRSSALPNVAGVTIIGLEGALIDVIEGAVSVSGVTLDDEGSVLVANNQGTLVVSESSADRFVAEGNDPVDAKDVKDFASLKAAIASGVKVIEIAADIARTDNDKAEVVMIDRSVTINGNDCTFNTAANRAFRLTVSDIEVTFNNLNIVSSAVMVYPSDVRGVSIDPDLSNVSLTMNNCSIDFTDVTTNDWTYAINVTGGNDNTVVINGGSYEGANVINVRGEKQTITIDGAELTSLYPSNETYYGACLYVLWYSESQITLVNSVLNGNNAVAINGCEDGKGNILVEENNTDNTKLYLYKAGSNLYYTLAEAIAAIDSEGEVKVLHNAKVDAVTVPNGKTITLNLNNKTIEGVDNATGSYAVITNKGNLTVVGPGALKLTATNNRGWNAYSSVISNTVGGNLTVQGEAVIEHLGGTDMAYGIDNLTNGKGTSAITTINKATVKSPYRAIRQFLNGVDATNELYVKAGAHIESVAKEDGSRNKSIWMQDPSANANTGKLVVEEGAKLYGDVYLFVCAGSTAWPVSVSISESALMNDSEVVTGNVPEGYTVENVNGTWKVLAWTVAEDAASLAAALAAGKNVVLANDLAIKEGITAPYGNKTALSQNGGVFNGNGKTITADLPGDNYVYMTNGGTTKNVNITGAFRGFVIMNANQTVYLENVVCGGKGVVYALNTTEGNSTQDLVATNCTFNGWSSWSLLKSATFTNCTFGQGSEYSNVYGRLLRPYVNTVFDGCDFCSKCYIDLSVLVAEHKVTIKNCSVNGVKITAENWASLVAPEDTCGEDQISVELKNGTFLTADNVADYVVFE